MEPMIGEIRVFGFNFVPNGWMFCNGQLLSIAEYSALFSILGTTYGGDGVTTFALPNLNGRAAVGFQTGRGLPHVELGQAWGSDTATLTSSNLPPVGPFTVMVMDGGASTSDPSNGLFAESQQPAYIQDTATAPLDGSSIQGNGMPGNQPIEVGGPNLAMNYCIAVEGIYPSRS